MAAARRTSFVSFFCDDHGGGGHDGARLYSDSSSAAAARQKKSTQVGRMGLHDMGRVEGRLWHAVARREARLRTSRLCRTLSVPLFIIETLTAVHAMPRWHQRRPPVSATSSSATHPAGRWNVHPETRHHSSNRPINPHPAASCQHLQASALS